ncbi:hypothetical protein BDK51DRAFT_50655 [Blyttiomyces helicus]|uniref:Uncharacterized protein n=1 Tax=Blyttiomyces helicus TaxID=388810 RepID=A0A4V1IQ07_9FUNG|nr:hypothetical protein BDK51DRAFT_50655 [Blyttiomyces helicus]|eukprot:RKO84897.1 hypothetical protein BDK51DRAFT_50655 [Blyttiomyces helicus]
MSDAPSFKMAWLSTLVGVRVDFLESAWPKARSHFPRCPTSPRRLTPLLKGLVGGPLCHIKPFTNRARACPPKSCCGSSKTSPAVTFSPHLWSAATGALPVARGLKKLLWTDVVPRLRRATLVRVLALNIDDWETVPADFALFILRLRGLRALLVSHAVYTASGVSALGVSDAVIATFISSCPRLVALQTPSPTRKPPMVEPGAAGDKEGICARDADHRDDPSAVARGVGRLKCLHLWGSGDTTLDLDVGREQDDANLPSFEAGALANLEVVELDSLSLNRVAAGLIEPALRCVASTSAMAFASTICLPCFMLAQPSTSSISLPNMIVNTGYDSMGVEDGDSEALTRLLRVRGSNLKLLDIPYTFGYDSDLLTCIGETTPLLEMLSPQNYISPHWRISRPYLDLDIIAFIAHLKRGCPNLRDVFPTSRRSWSSRCGKFSADVGSV